MLFSNFSHINSFKLIENWVHLETGNKRRGCSEKKTEDVAVIWGKLTGPQINYQQLRLTLSSPSPPPPQPHNLFHWATNTPPSPSFLLRY